MIELLPNAQSSSRNENFVSSSKNIPKNRNRTFPAVRYYTLTLVCLKYLVNNYLWKTFLASNSSKTLSNLLSLTALLTSNLCYSFNLKLEKLICKKALTFVLLDNYFSDLSGSNLVLKSLQV